MTRKDITLLASRYTQILNEGIFDRFKKKPQQTEDDDNPAYWDLLARGTPNKSERTKSIFDRFKKKPQQTEDDDNQSEWQIGDLIRGYPNKSERTITVNIFGREKPMSYNSLMYDSELVETIGEEPNFVELRIYKTSKFESAMRNEDIFIPVVVIHNEDDYPRPPVIIGKVGRGASTKEKAMQDLTGLGAEYKKNINNS